MKKFRTFRQQVTWLGRFKRGRPCGRWGKCWYFFLLPVFVLIERIQSTYLGICYKLEPKQGLILMRTIRRQDILTFWQGPGSGKRVVDGWLASQRAMAELQVLSFNNFSKYAKKVVFTDLKTSFCLIETVQGKQRLSTQTWIQRWWELSLLRKKQIIAFIGGNVE